MIEIQPELKLFKALPSDPHVARLRALLHDHGWQTRAELVDKTGLSERNIRALLEAMGADVVRSCVRGFKLTNDLTNDELGDALMAANFAISQARHQGNYGVRLKRRLHARIG